MSAKLKRAAIQKGMAQDVTAAIEKGIKALDLDMNDPDVRRRIFRAVVAASSGVLFDVGCPVPTVAQEAVRAVAQEAQHRENVKAIALGNIFGGGQPPAKA
jgi:hypothetical protein